MAVATLGAAVFAALAAFGGSLLTYSQGQSAIDVSRAQKVAELRLDAYRVLAGELCEARQKLLEVGNRAVIDRRLLEEAEVQELRSVLLGTIDARGMVQVVSVKIAEELP